MIGLSLSIPQERVVPASSVLAKIKAGQPADFDNCTILGDLNLSALMIAEEVHFNNTIFQNSVDCRFATFEKAANFGFSNFKGCADFASSNFNSTAYFRNSDFNGWTDFGFSNFNGDADFGFSSFNGADAANFMSSNFNGAHGAYFESSNFNEGANFASSNFNRDAYFRDSKFNRVAYFGDSNFNESAYFGPTKFNGRAYFRDSNFNEGAYFGSSNFDGDANFMSASFKGDAYFSDTKFNGALIADSTVFNKGVNFNDVEFNNTISFNDAQFVGDARFEKASFNKKLSLTRTRYDKLYIRWFNITGGLYYDDAAYMSLLQNFKNLGYFEDYDLCYYQYRVEHRNQPWPGIGLIEVSILKFVDVFLQYFYGYGKKPLYPLGWSIGTIIAFGILWGIAGQRRRIDEYSFDKNHAQAMWDKINSLVKPFIFSTTLFLSGTKLFVDPPEVPDIPGLSKSLVKGLFTLERVVGAFFSILFFLAVGTTIVR